MGQITSEDGDRAQQDEELAVLAQLAAPSTSITSPAKTSADELS